MVEGTGILLNNRMTYWHLDPDHINCLTPGHRVRHTMNPVMVFAGEDDAASNGELVLVCGTPGADTQVQTNMQVITHVLDFGLNVSAKPLRRPGGDTCKTRRSPPNPVSSLIGSSWKGAFLRK